MKKMTKVDNNIRYENLERKIHRVILGLDISTTCIGASVVIDDGESKPQIVKITHIAPKISKKIKGIESLFVRKQIFEEEFIDTLLEYNITDVIIEEPLFSSNNSLTVATLMRFNGMISEVIYRKLGVVPHFISSYDSRMFSFPELCSIRKYNKKGNEYPLKHIKKDLQDSHLVLFGSYSYDVDKKSVMMDMVNEMYPNIEWVTDKHGKIKKENYDACDSLVCTLAYININRYGLEKPMVTNAVVSQANEKKEIIIEYDVEIWDKTYPKCLILKD